MTTAVDVDLFREVIGQERAVAQLRAAAADPVHAYLFVGPSGSGKRAAAHAFAAALLAPPGADRDDRDARLALAGTHPDLLIVEREGASISVKQADDIVRAASLSPIEGDHKVLVLDEFHLMTAAVAPKLLKTIEEPPAPTIFVVLADDVPPELVTIASRCVRIDFGPVPAALVEATLVAEGVEEPAARLAAAAAGGDLDRARLLANDSGLAARRQAWHDIPRQLDGHGATVGAIVDELLGMIDAAAEPLAARQKQEAEQLQERIEQSGERGSGRKELEDRHKRELRRHRTDELRFGLATLAGAYRDRLVAGGTREDAAGRRHDPEPARGAHPQPERDPAAASTVASAPGLTDLRALLHRSEEAPHRARRLRSPERHDIVLARMLEPCEHRSEPSLLRAHQRHEVEPAPLPKHELEQQLGAHVADVFDRQREPTIDRAPSRRGRGQQRPRPRAELLHADGRDESHGLEPLGGPIDERSAERPDRPDLPGRSQQLHDRPAVRRLLAQECQRRPLAERELRQRRGDHAASVADLDGSGPDATG